MHTRRGNALGFKCRKPMRKTVPNTDIWVLTSQLLCMSLNTSFYTHSSLVSHLETSLVVETTGKIAVSACHRGRGETNRETETSAPRPNLL